LFHVEDAYNKILTMVFIFNWTYVYVIGVVYWMCISWIKMFIKMLTIDLGACCLFKLVMTIELLVEGAYDTINVHWGCSYDVVSAYTTNNVYLGSFCDLKVLILLIMLTHVAFMLRVLTEMLMPLAMFTQIV